MKRRLVLAVVFACMATFFAAILPSVAPAQSAPAAEKQKIEALIKQVGDLKDVKFVRNGSTYEPATAVRFLRGKWEANDAEVKTTRDFIDTVASVSGTSGKPYLIRFKDGREIKSQEFLLAELNKIEPKL
jgi:TctA family transporter